MTGIWIFESLPGKDRGGSESRFLSRGPGDLSTGNVMAEDTASTSPRVVLGFDAAWDFASADQTSPVLSGVAEALVDATMTQQRVTELCTNSAFGSNGPTMLEHPHASPVAGDTLTGFYRRWNPDGSGRPRVPWRLKAYSWRALTEASLASSWLLPAPFIMYNLAYFMPPASEMIEGSGESVGYGHNERTQ